MAVVPSSQLHRLVEHYIESLHRDPTIEEKEELESICSRHLSLRIQKPGLIHTFGIFPGLVLQQLREYEQKQKEARRRRKQRWDQICSYFSNVCFY